jgi:hypothetical protein
MNGTNSSATQKLCLISHLARFWAGDASVLSEARIRDGVLAGTMLRRAFDKTVRRKPLAFAADAVYGNSIDLVLEVIAGKGVARKAWLFIFVNVQLPRIRPSWYAAAALLSSADMLAPHTR